MSNVKPCRLSGRRFFFFSCVIIHFVSVSTLLLFAWLFICLNNSLSPPRIFFRGPGNLPPIPAHEKPETHFSPLGVPTLQAPFGPVGCLQVCHKETVLANPFQPNGLPPAFTPLTRLTNCFPLPFFFFFGPPRFFFDFFVRYPPYGFFLAPFALTVESISLFPILSRDWFTFFSTFTFPPISR